MAQGVILSDKSRDGIAALVWRNMGDLEEQMWEREQQWAEQQETFDGMQAALEQAGLRVLNSPNLIKQPGFTTRTYPTSAVISQVLNIPAEDATAAAAALTFTVTNEAITSSYVLQGIKSSNWDAVWYSMVTASCSAGSATITITARPGAHAAMTVTVYLCTVANQTVPYGETAHSWASSQPYLDSVNNNGDYVGQESDEIAEVGVTLTGANIVTEVDGTTYNQAVQFTVTNPPTNGWGNADKMIWNYPCGRSIEMENGQPKYTRYGEIDAMEVGETYTMSCWARITSGTKAMLWLGACPYNGQYLKVPNGYEYHEIEAKNGAWQRVSFTFVFNPTGDRFYTFTSNNKTYQGCNWTKTVGFGVCRKYAGTVQLCGFRLVRGKLWVCETYDDLEENVAALRGRVTTLETAAAADPGTATAAETQAIITEYGQVSS